MPQFTQTQIANIWLLQPSASILNPPHQTVEPDLNLLKSFVKFKFMVFSVAYYIFSRSDSKYHWRLLV